MKIKIVTLILFMILMIEGCGGGGDKPHANDFIEPTEI